MTELQPTDKFIVDHLGKTYKTSFSEIQNTIDVNLLGDNVSLDPNDTVNMTVDINTPVINFGGDWDPATQKTGKIYTNIGVGAVHESWEYIGGNKRDAKITLGTGQGGQIQSITLDDYIKTTLSVGEYLDLDVKDVLNMGSGGRVRITVIELQSDIDPNGKENYISDITIDISGAGYSNGDVEIDIIDGLTTETIRTRVYVAPESIQVVSIDVAGTDFTDGVFDNITGIGAELTLDITTTSGEISTASVKYVGYGYKPGNTVTLISPGAGEYGRDVTGYELTTWLGEEAVAGAAKPNEGWVILSSLSDDGGYVLRSGDEMFGTLSFLSAADPAITAINDITTDNGLYGATVNGYTSLSSGGVLRVEGKSTLSGGFVAGDNDHTITSTIRHILEVSNLAGYKQMTGDFDGVVIDDPSGGGNDTTVFLGDNNFITKGYFDKNNLGGGGGVGFEYDIRMQTQPVDVRDKAVFQLQEDGAEKTNMVFEVGNLLKLTADDGNNSLLIETEATAVIFSSSAPAFDVGKLWYNTLDGRLYVCYEDLGDGLPAGLPASVQWVDASPSAINGGDYVYKYGDIVNNFLRIQNDTANDPTAKEAVFFAQHYILDELKNIEDAPPTVPVP